MRTLRFDLTAACLAAVLGTLPLGAVASTDTGGERLSGEEIRELIWGNQVRGTMAGGEAYSETYGADGEIMGEGYSGKATIVDDTMCFDYGSGDVTCYGVRRNGDGEIEWLQDDDVAGNGTISEAP